MNDSCINLTFDSENADLWSVEKPNLYLAHIFLKDADGQPVDDLYETFGARTFRMQGSNFFLNNKKTILRERMMSAIMRASPQSAPVTGASSEICCTIKKWVQTAHAGQVIFGCIIKG